MAQSGVQYDTDQPPSTTTTTTTSATRSKRSAKPYPKDQSGTRADNCTIHAFNTAVTSVHLPCADSPRGVKATQFPTRNGSFIQATQINGVRVSSPLAKKKKTSDIVQKRVATPTSPLTVLPVEVKLIIFEYLEPDTLLALWRTSVDIYKVFYDRFGLKLWNELRQASGLAPTPNSQRPTRDELLVILYALDDACEYYVRIELQASNAKVCGSRGASHQLPLVTRQSFIDKYGKLFIRNLAAFEAIGWYNPADIPALQFSSMAASFIDASSEDISYFVASRRLANFAVETVQQQERSRSNKSEILTDEDVVGLILSAHGELKYLLDPIQERLDTGSIELDHLRKKHQKQ
ncbi:hypothetical protein FRC00_002806 [Tulasnella sp. 408]|nr:hypothetical protein FRC00_002806 [Tulasnella sp. 408]